MKLIIAILRDIDNEQVSKALVIANFRVTRVASTGGFWRRGSTTLMIGVEDEKVEEAIQVIRDQTSPDTEKVDTEHPADKEHPGISRATLFVLNVENFTQI